MAFMFLQQASDKEPLLKHPDQYGKIFKISLLSNSFKGITFKLKVSFCTQLNVKKLNMHTDAYVL